MMLRPPPRAARFRSTTTNFLATLKQMRAHLRRSNTSYRCAP
jgi:hypothetical protein